MLPALRRGSLVELAVEALREQITAGGWAVGQRLPTETELAETLQVGRSTVREAVRVLVHAGMLETRQGAGTFVRSTTGVTPWERRLRRAEILEVYEVREALETQAASLAAARRTDVDIERIDRTLRARNRARTRGKDSAFVRADFAFHEAVVAAAHNGLLTEMFTSFSSAFRDALAKQTSDAAMAEVDVSEAHDELAAAITRGEPSAAWQATQGYLRPTTDALRALIDSTS